MVPKPKNSNSLNLKEHSNYPRAKQLPMKKQQLVMTSPYFDYFAYVGV